MLNLIYRALKFLACRFSSETLAKFRFFGQQLAGLGTEQEFYDFYLALGNEELNEARFWLESLARRVGNQDPQVLQAKSFYFDTVRAIQDRKEAEAFALAEKTPDDDVKFFLKSSIKSSCPDPDEEDTEMMEGSTRSNELVLGEEDELDD